MKKSKWLKKLNEAKWMTDHFNHRFNLAQRYGNKTEEHNPHKEEMKKKWYRWMENETD